MARLSGPSAPPARPRFRMAKSPRRVPTWRSERHALSHSFSLKPRPGGALLLEPSTRRRPAPHPPWKGHTLKVAKDLRLQGAQALLATVDEVSAVCRAGRLHPALLFAIVAINQKPREDFVMTRWATLAIGFLAFCSFPVTGPAQAQSGEGWIALFDGKNLDHW